MTTHVLLDVFGNTHTFDTQTTEVSSDWHINHQNILKYGRGEKWLTLDAMNHGILDAIWDAGQRSETLLTLGDLLMGIRDDGLTMIRDLGITILNQPGNHDHTHPMHKKHMEWVEKYREAGIVTLMPEVHLTTEIGEVTLCHFPFDGDHTEEARYLAWRPQDRGQFLVHGHLHGTKGKLTGPRSVDVGVDAWDYQFIRFADIFNVLETGQP